MEASYAEEVPVITLAPNLMPMFRRQYANHIFTGNTSPREQLQAPDPDSYPMKLYMKEIIWTFQVPSIIHYRHHCLFWLKPELNRFLAMADSDFLTSHVD